MSIPTAHPRRVLLAVLVLATAAAASPGCAKPTAPPAPPSGGRTITLSYAQFADSVEPVLSRQGCDAEGDCHGGGIRGTLALSPPSAKDTLYDFHQVTRQVSAYVPDSSAILRAPLALDAGGTPHPFKPFGSTADPDWRTMRGWVDAGVVK